jgi:hypothetical protein
LGFAKLIRDYAATWAAAVKEWFWGHLAWGKSAKGAVLEAGFSCQRHVSTSFLEKIPFSDFWAYQYLGNLMLFSWEA